MKKLASLLVMLIVATAAFAQTYTFKSADKNPCKVTLNGDKIVIEETLFGDSKAIMGIWLYKKDIAFIAKKLKL